MKFFHITLLLVPTLLFSQNPYKVLHPETGGVIKDPEGFVANTDWGVISHRLDGNFYANQLLLVNNRDISNLLTTSTNDTTYYDLYNYYDVIPQKKSNTMYNQEFWCLSMVNGENKLFVWNNDGQKGEFIPAPKKITQPLIPHKDGILCGNDVYGISDTIGLYYDFASEAYTPVLKPRMDIWLETTVPFKDKLVAPTEKKINSDAGTKTIKALGVFNNPFDEHPIIVTPNQMFDTITAPGGYAQLHQVYATDSLLYFIYAYFNNDYHQYALFVSEGKSGDAKKVKVLHEQDWLDKAGAYYYWFMQPLVQDYVYYQNQLYFYAGEAVKAGDMPHSANIYRVGKNNVPEKVSDVKVFPYSIYTDRSMALVGDYLYVMALDTSKRYTNLFTRINLQTGEEKLIAEGNFHHNLKVLNDSLLLIGDSHYQLYNAHTEEIIIIDERMSIIDNSMVIDNILYYEGYDNGQYILMAYSLGNSTAIAENEVDSHWVLFPNPAQQEVFLQNTLFQHQEVELVIHNVQGKKILRTQHRLSQPLSVASFTPGMYYIRLLNNKGEIVGMEKLVVQ